MTIDSSWHADAELLRRYTQGRADLALSASIEAHLLHCPQCRARLAGAPAAGEALVLERAWAGVREQIQRPPLPLSLRLLRRLGLDEQDAVLLSASQSLRGPWTLATIVVLVFAAAASFPGDAAGQAFYLLVAPLIPVLGVVSAFNAAPGSEITGATPYSKTRLALLRTAAVTLTTVPLVVFMGAIVPGLGWFAFGWLGPAIGLTLAALVLLTWWRPQITGGVVSIAWALVVGAAYGRHHLGASVAPGAQLAYLVLAALAATVLFARIRTARTPGGYA